MGAASGVATLDTSGKVPSSQLPSYVDDVLEYTNKASFPSTGEAGKIYVDKATNLTWRWSGSAYVEISPSLALGETSSTAYAGDKGKALADKLTGIESGAQVHKAPTAAEVKSALGTGSGTSKYLREDGTWQTPPDHTYTVNNGTFAVKGAGTQVASTSANASGNSSVDIVAGSNVTITPDATNGKITISSTDTNSWRPVSDSVSSTDSSTAASLKAVKTAYDLAASKTSNTGTVTKVSAGTGLTGGDITTTGTIALATSGVTAGTYKRVTVDAYGRVTSGDNTDADTNTARLQVSDTTNKRINTKESTGNYIQFTGGTNKFTVGDGTNSFDVAVTPSVSFPVSSVAGNTGAVTTTQIASALTSAGYKLTDSDTNTWRPVSDSVTSTDSSTSASSKAVKTAYDLAASKTSNTGTVTSVATGVGLTGGTITGSGTIKAKLKSETASTLDSAAMGSTANRQYAVGVDKSGYLSVNVPWVNSTYSVPTKVSQLTNDSGYTTNVGTVTQVNVGSTAYNPSSGVVSLPAYPTSLPASDVYSWAKASAKPSYTASEVGLGNVGNFKAVSTVASQGLSATEKSNARANIGAGTSSFSGSYNDLTNKPTIPTVNNGTLNLQASGTTKTTFTANQSGNSTFNIATGSSNGTISVGGADVAVKGLGAMAYKASLAASDIPSITKSKISDFPSSMPASDVSAWAKASSKPTYIANEVMSISMVSISANTSSSCSITGTGDVGKAQTIIYLNTGSSDVTVTVPTTYRTPNGEAIELTCPVGGYCEVSYLNLNYIVFARGL